ncbi:MAG TPA: 50S ribosomal protein L22 [Gammaproteobacteria bacterium]|nr:50S ribosomal protein L22 [Gammaproteobacteria bacterium]
MKKVRAVAKKQRLGVLKAREVVNVIRGKSVDKALDFLTFCEKKAARLVFKTLSSAVANAENNVGLDVDDLSVVEAWVDQGPVLKRWKARAKGRGNRILKPTCNITVVVANPNDKEKN